MKSQSSHYDLVSAAIHHLVERRAEQPSLAELAAALGISALHFQRVFSAWAGISPKRFLQFLDKEYARALLADSRPVLDAAFAAGLSSGGRLHDLLVACEAATPGQIRQAGRGLEIRHGIADTPFGPTLLGITARGVCHMQFVAGVGHEALAGLEADWPEATLRNDPDLASATAVRIFSPATTGPDCPPLHVLIRGTNFQIRVWQALLAIPEGHLTTYSDLARRLGLPRGARAVGNAVAANPVAVLIPCHRVIRESGALGGYRWGLSRKLALLARESPFDARRQPGKEDSERPDKKPSVSAAKF